MERPDVEAIFKQSPESTRDADTRERRQRLAAELERYFARQRRNTGDRPGRA